MIFSRKEIRKIWNIYNHRARACRLSNITPHSPSPWLRAWADAESRYTRYRQLCLCLENHTHTLNDFYLEDRNLSDRKWFCLEDIKQSNTNSFFGFLRFSCMPQFLGFQMKWIMTPQNAYFHPTQVIFLGFENSLDSSLGHCEDVFHTFRNFQSLLILSLLVKVVTACSISENLFQDF